jgi:hypothetical protein
MANHTKELQYYEKGRSKKNFRRHSVFITNGKTRPKYQRY